MVLFLEVCFISCVEFRNFEDVTTCYNFEYSKNARTRTCGLVFTIVISD